MKFLSSLSGTLQHHIGTLVLSLVLAVCVGYYALAYLPQRRHELEQRYFRVLARVGHNIQDRIRIHQKVNEGVASFFSVRNFPADTVMDLRRDIDVLQQSPNTALTSATGLRRIRNAWYRLVPYCAELRFDSIKQFRPGTPAFRYRPQDQNLVFQHRLWKPLPVPAAKLRRRQATDSADWALYTVIAASRFIEPFARLETFQHFYVADHLGQFIYSNHPDGPIDLTNFLASKKVLENKRDTVHWQVRELEMNGQPSLLFLLPLRLRAHDTQVWYLAGTVALQDFRQEQYSLPRGLQELLFGVLLLGLLSLPFLKVSLLNEHERLNYADVVQCGLGLLLGCGLLTLTTVAELTRRYPETSELDQQLQDLATQVQGSLETELRDLNTTLYAYRRLYAAGAATGSYNPSDKAAALLVNQIPPGTPAAPIAELARPLGAYDMIVRIRKDGAIMHYQYDTARTRPLIYGANLAERNYFRMAQQQQWMRLPESVDSSQTPFTLDAIVSYRLAVKTVALAQAAPDSTFCALVTRNLHTFQAPVLPPYYAFCLIDAKGEVLFHSDEHLGMSENLLEDCQSPKLTAALRASEPVTLAARYQGYDHRLYVRPLPTLGLTLVTLADLRVSRAQHSQAYALGAALLTGMWLLWLLGGLLLRALRPTRNVLLLPRYRLRALWPRRRRAPLYLALAVLFGLVLLVVLFELPSLSLSVRLLLVLILPLALYPVTRLLLTRPAQLSDDEPDTQDLLVRSPARQVTTVLGMLVLLNIVVLSQQAEPTTRFWDNPWLPALGIQAVILLGFFALRGVRHWVRRIQPLASRPAPAGSTTQSEPPLTRLMLGKSIRFLYLHYRFAYALLLLAWLGVGSIVPALVCYQASYQLVRLLHVREAHLHLMTALARAVNPATQKGVGDDFATKAQWPNTYFTFFFDTKIQNQSAADQDNLATMRPESFVRRFYPNPAEYQAILLEPDYILHRGNLAEPDPNNHWYWRPADTVMQVSSQIIPAAYHPRQYLFSTLPEPLFSADWWRTTTYAPAAAVLTVLALSLVLWLLYHLIRQVFAPSMLNQKPSRELHAWPLSTSPNHYIFNPAGVSPTRVLRSLKLDTTSPVVDCRTITASTEWQPILEKLHLQPTPPVTQLSKAAHWLRGVLPRPAARKYTALVLQNFEFQVGKPAITEQKTALLRMLNQIPGLRVIILARVHPRAFTDCGHTLEKDCHDASHHALQQAGHELLDELSLFRLQHIPLFEDAQAATPESSEVLPKHFLSRECHNLDFLARIRPDIEANLHYLHQIGYCIERDVAVLTIKRMGMLYFRSLWRRLSAHEQFLLFDLAQDGIINTNNWPVLDSLVRKGYLLVGHDDRLRIMSEGFRAYILSTVPRQQALSFEEKERRQGVWSRLSLPLLLLLASAAVFLAATQGETLSVAQQYLALLTGLVPLLLRLFSSGAASISAPVSAGADSTAAH